MTSIISTIIACFIGSFLLILTFFMFLNKIPELVNFISYIQLIYVLLISSGLNLGISILSTWICVRRYLNLKTDDLYN